MKINRGTLERIEKTLKSAYRNRTEAEKEEIPVSAQWQSSVMAHIRQINTLRGRINNLACLSDDILETPTIVWRFAAAVCLCTVITALFLSNSGVSLSHTLVQQFFEDPYSSAATIAQVFSIP
ncbi:hypothetical protein MCHI_001317 [Candidatus Magnetoovum chiemensis]|nr:hypothetical protein MCHI_001317 [Candidatus Magnetoovum chiemensis]